MKERFNSTEAQSLLREKTRQQGLLKICSAVSVGNAPSEMEKIINYYRESANAFEPPTNEGAEHAFYKDLEKAHQYQHGVIRTKQPNGFVLFENVTLGGLINQTEKRIQQIDNTLGRR